MYQSELNNHEGVEYTGALSKLLIILKYNASPLLPIFFHAASTKLSTKRKSSRRGRVFRCCSSKSQFPPSTVNAQYQMHGRWIEATLSIYPQGPGAHGFKTELVNSASKPQIRSPLKLLHFNTKENVFLINYTANITLKTVSNVSWSVAESKCLDCSVFGFDLGPF